MKLQDIKARTSFREQYKPGMTIDAYSPDAIKNALIFINKKILSIQAEIARYQKDRDPDTGEWKYPQSAETSGICLPRRQFHAAGDEDVAAAGAS